MARANMMDCWIVTLTFVTFAYTIFIGVYLLVPLNSIYTHQGVESSNLPYLSRIPNTKINARRGLDYYIQWITDAIALFPMSIGFFCLYYISTGRHTMTWFNVGSNALALVAWILRFVYEGYMWLGCKNQPLCTREDPDGEVNDISDTFSFRFIGSGIIMIFLFVFVVLSLPMKKLEERKQAEVEKYD